MTPTAASASRLTYEDADVTTYSTAKMGNLVVRVQAIKRANEWKLGIPLERDGEHAGGMFAPRAELGPLCRASVNAGQNPPVPGSTGAIVVRAGARYECSVGRALVGGGWVGTVEITSVRSDGTRGRTNVYSGELLANLNRAIDHVCRGEP